MNVGKLTHVQSAKPWAAPHFDQPMLVKARDLKPLGEIRGYLWYTLARFDGELCARPQRLTDHDVIPNAIVAQHDEKGAERSYSVLDAFAPGSFAKYAAEPARRFGPPTPAPLRLVDALPALHAPRARVKIPQRLGGSLTGIVDDGRAPLAHGPKVRLFGVAAIVADLGRRGIVVGLATDRAAVVVRSRTDILAHDANLVQFVRDAVPLLLGHLRGEPLRCTVGTHGTGTDATAVTLLVGGAPCCQTCLAGGAG
ncbi:MAG TPA: hypothetical protein VIK13_06795 [Candidatus Limnocylindrales bacterium]